MSDAKKIEQYLEEEVVVTTTDGTEIVGELEEYEEDFSLVLTGDGHDPDEITVGEIQQDFVDGERILNGANVRDVKRKE